MYPQLIRNATIMKNVYKLHCYHLQPHNNKKKKLIPTNLPYKFFITFYYIISEEHFNRRPNNILTTLT